MTNNQLPLKNEKGIIPNEQIIPFKERLLAVIGKESVRSFSRKCELSDKTLRDYIQGKSYPTLDRLSLIASAANVDLAWLATGAVKDKKAFSQGIDTDEHKQDSRLAFIAGALGDDGLNELLTRLQAGGVDKVLIDRKAINTALVIHELTPEAQREILLLINAAQYCALADIPFKASQYFNQQKKVANSG